MRHDTAIEVSIVIATNDRWPRLAASVASALAQTGLSIEVIVVDGASADPPRLVSDDDERVRWVRQAEPMSPSTSRNRGVRSAYGEWIAFLEEGDLWAPDHLATLVHACERGGADFGYCASWVVDDASRIRWFRKVPAPDALPKAVLREDVLGSASSLVVRRPFWDTAGGFDEWLTPLAAWDLSIRWSRAGRASMSAEPKVAAVEPDVTPDAERELRELRRRYGDDAKRLGVRFGEGIPKRRRRWLLSSKLDQPAPAPGDASPPWLSALSDAIPNTNESPR